MHFKGKCINFPHPQNVGKPPFEIGSCYNNVSCRRALFEISLQEIEAKLGDIQHAGRHTQGALFVRTIIWPVLMYMIS